MKVNPVSFTGVMIGRKTDVNDAIWLAEWLTHGLIRRALLLEPPIQELRGLLRIPKQLMRE